MAHDIYEERFVAVRTPAWHALGTVFDRPVAPSEAVEVAGLDVGAEVLPLVVQRPDGTTADTGLVAVGRWEGDDLVVYGTAKEFELLTIQDVLPRLDEIAGKFPLSAAGTLAKGGEVFFTFSAGESEIAGEQYQDYLVYRHSYTPGIANMIMWTPVRVVCRNTVIAGERDATFKISVAHTSNVREVVDAGLVVAQAVRMADIVRSRLEQLAKKQMSRARVAEVLKEVYAPYAPSARSRIPAEVADLVDRKAYERIVRPQDDERRYVEKLTETALAAYDRLCDEAPHVAGTAYAVYHAVVETADFRKGRGSMEAAVVGWRAQEKARAWKILMTLN